MMHNSVITESHLVYDLNQTEHDFGCLEPLHALVEMQTSRTPSQVVAKLGQDTITRQELNAKANQLAVQLISMGAGVGKIVGVHFERSFELLIALLAVLKTGAAFCPLDSSLPKRRLQEMTKDLDCPVIVTSHNLQASFLEGTIPVSVVNLNDWTYEHYASTNLSKKASRHDIAYAIFTSGTTGQPKATTITHAGICNFLEWLQEKYQLNDTDVVLQKTNISFDVCIWELFWPLITGARLVFAEPKKEADSAYLVDLVQTEKVSIIGFPSTMLSRFLDEPEAAKCVSLRWVNFGGDTLSVALQRRFFTILPNCLFHNLYGPAEAAIVTIFWECDQTDELDFVPIGRPIANTKVYTPRH